MKAFVMLFKGTVKEIVKEKVSKGLDKLVESNTSMGPSVRIIKDALLAVIDEEFK